MKSSVGLITVSLFLGLLSSVMQPSIVSAQDGSLSDDQLKQIKSSCVSAKTTLNRLHSNDALMRVNAGQVYESLSTKLMDGFNARVANNSMNNSGLVSAAGDYESSLNLFRNDYMSYENQLSKAIDIDCMNHPSDFYAAVVSARTKRGTVYADVLKLNQYIDSYSSAVDKFEKEYLTALSEVSK